MAVITGTPTDDILIGGDDSDSIKGGAGNDFLADYSAGDDSLFGGLGDDYLQIFRRDTAPSVLLLDGGDGDDTITYAAELRLAEGLYGHGINGDRLTVAGGAGNDRINIEVVERAEIDGGSGVDHIQIDAGSTWITATLGTEADIFELRDSGQPVSQGAIIVTDFAAGADGDRIYLTVMAGSNPLDRFATNPFATGELLLVQDGADTLLQADGDGPGGAGPVTLLVLQGVTASALTQDNLGFAPDGGVPAGRQIEGTALADHLLGQGGDDVLAGHDGDDWLVGSAGNDQIDGGAGSDFLNGGAGDDALLGGAGDDQLRSHDISNDTLQGGDGDDLIAVRFDGTAPAATLELDGGEGNDHLSYFAFDRISDRLVLRGGGGNDAIFASLAGETTVEGGDGDDYVVAEIGGGPVAVALGAGVDRLAFSHSFFSDAPVTSTITVADLDLAEDLIDLSGLLYRVDYWLVDVFNPFDTGVLRIIADGTDTLVQRDGDGGADAFVTVLRLAGVALDALLAAEIGVTAGAAATVGSEWDEQYTGTDQGERFYAGAGNDWLVGLAGDDTLAGEAGDDVIEGGDGHDYLHGGAGADRMTGGQGNDSYWVDSQDDLTFEGPDGGLDRVYSTASVYLYANIEELRLTAGSAAIYGVGNALDNQIDGNEQANLLLGGRGDDALWGQDGDDALYGQSGGDNLNGDAGSDTLVGGTGHDQLRGGTGADALYGEDGDDYLDGGDSFDTDILVGGEGNDVLDGRSGQADPDYDLLDGGNGDDFYVIDTGDDLTFEADGGGHDTVFAAIEVAGAGVYLYAFVEDLELAGVASYGVGNDRDNALTGNTLDNLLLGGTGNDTLNGMRGNDVLFGEDGADSFVFRSGFTGADVIGDFAPGTDRIALEGFGLDFAQLQELFFQDGSIGAIQFANGEVIVLHGVTMADLTAADFILG